MELFHQLYLRIKACWWVLMSPAAVVYALENFGPAMGGKNIAICVGPMEMITVAITSRSLAKDIIQRDGGVKAVKRKYGVDEDTDVANFINEVSNG